MPRVLIILNRLIVGGISTNAIYLTKYLQPDFETLLVTGEQEEHEQGAEILAASHGIVPYCIPEMKRNITAYGDWKAYSKLKKLIREFKPDIVHTHAAKSGALGRLAAKHCGVPVILHTFHGHIFHSYFNSFKSDLFVRTERWLAGFSDAIIAISETQKKELQKDFKIAPAEKFRVIPLGLELDCFISDQEIKRKSFRTEYGLDDGMIAIGIIGRLAPVKNHFLFLKGIKHVLETSEKKIKAFIVGDGESRQAIEQAANSMGLEFSRHTDAEHPFPLIFTSWRTDVDIIYAGLDIVTLTSLNEGTPVSLIEAQAAGKPIVSTRVGGITDVVIENKTALLSDSNNESVFAGNLMKMVSDPLLRNSFAQAGPMNILSKYGHKRLIEDMSKLYFELLEKKSVFRK